MRLDKYLKVSRIIKRRTVANEACEKGHVFLNGKDTPAKASAEIKEGDTIMIRFGEHQTHVKVTSVKEFAPKAEAAEMFELISRT